MSARCNGRACIGSHTNEEPTPTASQKQKSSAATNNKRSEDNASTKSGKTSCSFRIPKRKDLSLLKYLKHLGGKMVGVLRMMSPRRASPKVNSERVKPFVAPVDSHRAEAIDDCIEFINSSSSLPRSNSTSQ